MGKECKLYSCIFLLFVGLLVVSCEMSSAGSTEHTVEDPKSSGSSALLEMAQNIHWQFAKDIRIILWEEQLVEVPEAEELTERQTKAAYQGGVSSLKGMFQQVCQKIPHSKEARNKLKYLDLSSQNLNFLPREIGTLKQLNFLALRYNKLKALPPQLGQCKQLKTLDLSSNALTKLPFGLIYLKSLRKLILSDNKLSKLPSYLVNLRGLKQLDISNVHPAMAEGYNNIRELPSVVLKLRGLERLFLDKLPLKSLPSNLRNLSKLKVISLNSCRLMNLEKAITALSKLPNLIALDISFIGRRRLPASIRKLKNLKVLVWHEERKMNKEDIDRVQSLLPNTKIYYGKAGIPTPFLRGNSIELFEKL